jgi:heptosyltransferase-2
MAAALGARLISVLGPTVAEEWAPWGPRVTVVQKAQPADASSDADTSWPSAEEVLNVAREMLANGCAAPAAAEAAAMAAPEKR